VKWARVRSKLGMGALGLLLGLSTAGDLYAVQAEAGQGARLVTVSRAAKRSKAKPSTAVSRAQMEMAQQMARNAYALGRQLEARQRVALMTRLLYTMRPEVMAAEKKEWAEELFGLAQQLPSGDAAEAAITRDAAIATAAARLAVYDADRALDLLDALPSEGGRREDARTMAARLVFAVYLQHHGAPGVQTLLAHGRRWGEGGGFPYGASAVALARLRPNEDAAEDFFRQVLAIFERGQEGLFGVRDFASLLERAASMEAISEDSAEEAGRSIVGELGKLTEGQNREGALTEEQKRLMVAAVNDVRISSPKAYEEAKKNAPELLALRAEPQLAPQVEIPKVDEALQSAFHELAEAVRAHRKPDELRAVIGRGLRVVNDHYASGACAECLGMEAAPAAGAGGYAAKDAAPVADAGGYALSRSGGWRMVPDAQSWAVVSLAAFATPMTIATQLTGIKEPFWRAYFLAIAAGQVGEPTRVADPTARRVPGKEEAEPE